MNLLSSTTGSTNQLIVTSDGKLAINGVSFGEETKPYERLFGMTEDEIYKKFGLIFSFELKRFIFCEVLSVEPLSKIKKLISNLLFSLNCLIFLYSISTDSSSL